jgi:4a-hydroxytetrahydrobiopterin dehydratase
MSESGKTVEGWTFHDRPPNLFRRVSFISYAETRQFLDRLAALSKETGTYPDVSFGKTYANVTVHASDGQAISDGDCSFARQANDCL